MADDPRKIAEELFNMMMKSASSAKSRKTQTTKSKEEKEYVENTKKRNNILKEENSISRDKLIREKVIGQEYEKIIKRMEEFDNSIDTAAKRAKTLQDLDKIPDAVSKTFERSSSAYVRSMSSQIKSLEDVFKFQELTEQKVNLIKTLRQISSGTKLDPDAFESLKTMVNEAGTSFKDLGIETRKYSKEGKVQHVTINNTNQNLNKLSEEANDLSKAFDYATLSIDNKFRGTIEKVSEYWIDELKRMGSIASVLAALNESRQDFRKQEQYAAADATPMLALEFGVSLRDMIDAVVDSRTTMLAMQSGGRNALQAMEDTQDQLVNLSGSNVQAMKDNIAMQKNIAQFGVSQKDLKGAANDQIKMYKQQYQALGYSVEQFNQLSETIVNDVDTRRILAGLDAKDRKGMVESLQSQYALNVQTYGAAKAMEVLKKQQEMATMGPMQRYRTAMLAESAFNMVGKGNLGGEFRNLMLKLPGLKGDEKTAALDRLTAIKSEVSSALETQRANNLGQAMSTEVAWQKLGFDPDQFLQLNAETAQGNKIDQETANTSLAQGRETNEILRFIDTKLETVSNFLSSSFVQLGIASSAALVLGLTNAGLFKRLEQIRDAILTKKGVVGDASGTSADKLGKDKKGWGAKLGTLGKVGGAVVSVGFAGKQIYDTAQNAKTDAEKGEGYGSATGSLTGTAIGGVIGSLIAPGIGTAIGMGIGGYVGEMIGSKVGKDIMTPSSVPESEVMKNARQATEGEQHNLKIIQNLQKMIDELRIRGEENSEQFRQLIEAQRIQTVIMKKGNVETKESIDKQTQEYINTTRKSSSATLVRGSATMDPK